jgi:hypothetical protein
VTRLALVAALLLLGGCSTLRFAYENADTYLRWKLGGYFSLQSPDAEWLDEKVDEFHAWHRHNELPKYARLAREAANRVADGISAEDMVWGYDGLRAQGRASLRKGAELLAPLLDRLTPEQIAHLEQGIAEDNRQYQRDFLRVGERERRRHRAKIAQDRVEDWVGKLSQAQVERIRAFAERTPLLDELRDRDRKRLQVEVLAIVRAHEARKRLPERLTQWEAGREPAFTAGLEVWRKEVFALVADLDRTFTAEQRARAVSQLRRYAEDFEALSAR